MGNELDYNMHDSAYHSIDAASNSTIGKIELSPAHCRAYLDGEFKETPAMIFGRMVHKIVLEREEFCNDYAVYPEEIDRRTKAGKEEYAAFMHVNGNKCIVKGEDFKKADDVYNAIMKNKTASSLLAQGAPEVSCFWQDREYDFPCKARFDFINKDGWLVDLKTTRDASSLGFSKAIINFGYHRQAAMYSDGYRAVTGKEPKGFVFIAVETEPPYAVAVHKISGPSLQVGYESYRSLLGKYVECVNKDEWPGYPDEMNEIDIPDWAMTKHEDEIDEEII